MNILVTGGAGFIGSNLCRSLIANNYKVICVDNESTGKKNNINELLVNSNFSYISHDISSGVLDLSVDVIFNLACPTPPAFVKNNPELVINSSIQGTKNIIKVAEKNKSKIIHISSVRVLEDPVGANVYSDSKKESEQLISEYDNFIIIRMASVYGPGMLPNDSRVIPQFIQKALNNKSLHIWGDGSQQDTFVYIDDVISFMVNSMLIKETRLCTIGSKVPISIKNLAHKIIKLTNSLSQIEYINGYTSNRTLDFLRDVNNFHTNISLTTGLINTIKYFKTKLKVI